MSNCHTSVTNYYTTFVDNFVVFQSETLLNFALLWWIRPKHLWKISLIADPWTVEHRRCVISLCLTTSPMEAVMVIQDIETGMEKQEEVFPQRMEMPRVGDRISGITQYCEWKVYCFLCVSCEKNYIKKWITQRNYS